MFYFTAGVKRLLGLGEVPRSFTMFARDGHPGRMAILPQTRK